MIYFLFLGGCFICFILQGFFAASEISVISSNLLKLHHRKNKGDKRAERVYELLLNPERFLATTLVGINISLVLSSSFLTFFLIHSGIGKSNLWITALFTPMVVIFAELIPKNIGRVYREDFSLAVIGIIVFFEKFFQVILKMIEAVSCLFIKGFVGNVRPRSLFVTKEEIKALVKEIEETGGIDRGEKKAIDEVFEFKNKKIKDIYVSFTKVSYLNYNNSYQQVLEVVKKNIYTRYPVVKEKEIIGYINIYDLFYNEEAPWQFFIRPIAKVDIEQRVYEVFTKLKAGKETIALVSEGKRILGVVTLQDIGKEILNSLIRI